MSKRFQVFTLLGATILGALLLPGCASAPVKEGEEISPDDDPLKGGISSADVCRVGQTMGTKILALPEIADSDSPIRIHVTDFTNRSRFMIDRDLFMKSLRLELNRYGEGKVRFFNSNAKVSSDRAKMLTERQEEQVRRELGRLGKLIAASPICSNAKSPLKIAVVPVLSTNLVNMNADSFAAMLRSEIVEAAQGKIQFLAPGTIKGADLLLTGQFYPESMRKEGIVNMADYIEVINDRLRRGQSLDVTDGTVPSPGSKSNTLDVNVTRGQCSAKESALVKILNDPSLRRNANVNQYLTLMLIRPADNVAVWEKQVKVQRKITDNSERADLILSGEISGLHQRRQGVASDYLMITVQLTNPESNEVVMEDAYEVKRLSDAGIVYR